MTLSTNLLESDVTRIYVPRAPSETHGFFRVVPVGPAN
jgi:hypothetical protein